jgi:hypothetical protein
MRPRAIRKAQADEFPMNLEGVCIFFELFFGAFCELGGNF